MDDNDDLGPVEAWQIKGFPRRLREDVIRAARDRQMTIAEFLTQLLVSARALNWHGPGNGDNAPAFDHRRLERAVCMASSAAATAAQMPKGVQTLTWQLVKSEMKTIKKMAAAAQPRPLPDHPDNNGVNLLGEAMLANPEMRRLYELGAQGRPRYIPVAERAAYMAGTDENAEETTP